MKTLPMIDTALLACATGGRGDVNPGLPLGMQPLPSDWTHSTPTLNAYDNGAVPKACTTHIGPNGKYDRRRTWAIPPANCYSQPGDFVPDGNQ
jgi:hypothetical protein